MTASTPRQAVATTLHALPRARSFRRRFLVPISIVVALIGASTAFLAPLQSQTWSLVEQGAHPAPLFVEFPFGALVTVSWTGTSSDVQYVYIQSPSGSDVSDSSAGDGSVTFIAQSGHYQFGLDWTYNTCQQICPPSCPEKCSQSSVAMTTFSARWALA